MIDYTNASKNILALAGKLSPAIAVRALEVKIKDCKKLITLHKLDLAIEHLEGVHPE